MENVAKAPIDATVERTPDSHDWANLIESARAVAARGFPHNSIGVATQLQARIAFLLRQLSDGATRGDAGVAVDSREERMLAALERAAFSGHGAMRLVRWPARLGARIDLSGDLTEIEQNELDPETRVRIERDRELWEATLSGLRTVGSWVYCV